MSVIQSTLRNVWLGVSVEDQQRAEERIPDLLATPAEIRWLSCEPLIGPIDFAWCLEEFREVGWVSPLEHLDWVVVGGESGRNARPMHPDWARTLRHQCAAAGVPFFFKQWGAWLPWEFADPPFLRSQAGHYEDGHRLPDADDDPKWDYGWSNDEFEDHCLFEKVGKASAGRLLDGRTHDAMPEISP